VGFAGDKCDRCDSNFINYPTCDGDIWNQNKRLFSAVFATMIASGIVLLFMKRKNPAADNLSLFLFLLGSVDMVTDILFFKGRLDDGNSLLICLTAFFVFVPLMLDLGLSLMIMHREQLRNAEFNSWVKGNNVVASAVTLLSASGTEMLLFLSSGVFNLDCLKAPFSSNAIDFIKIISIVGLVLEDIPQLALQIVVLNRQGRDRGDTIVFLNLCTSALIICYGITSKFLLWSVKSGEKQSIKLAGSDRTISVSSEMSGKLSALSEKPGRI